VESLTEDILTYSRFLDKYKYMEAKDFLTRFPTWTAALSSARETEEPATASD